MRGIAAKGISAWAPATAMVMCCLTPAASAREVSWGGSYEGASQRTANTVVTIPITLPRTASVVRTSSSEESEKNSPWREPLKNLQSDLHATVSQLARALRVRRQSIHAWQRGEKTPSVDNQARILQLQIAAIKLKDRLGRKLPIYLNYPLGETDESFWDLLAMGIPAHTAASTLVETATGSIRRRKALSDVLENVLGEPLDGQV